MTGKQIGQYAVLSKLGEGGMGVVYLARDPRLNRQIAIKVLPDAVARDPAHLARFEREATLLAASLPNPIARDAGEPGRTTEILASRLRARLGNSDVFVSCLGLRSMRPAPVQAPRTEPKPHQKAPPPKAATTKTEPQIPPWRTTTDPAFNPWQN